MKARIDEEGDPDPTTAAARDWLVRAVSGTMSADESRDLQAWLAASRSHREAFEVERRFWDRLGALRAASGPATWDGAEAPTRRHVPLRTAGSRSRRTAVAGGLIAACAALIMVLAGDLGASLTADYSTGSGVQRRADLPDGSIVYLNTDSAIAVDFDGGERRVELQRGEAEFKVARDPDRPFRVTAAGGVTEAVGTAFVVRLGDDEATVTVTEGRVEVTSPAGSGGRGRTIRAVEGQRTGYRRGQAPRPPESADVAAATLWQRGVIRIDDLPLDAALRELDRYRVGRIVLLGSRAAYRPVSGAFDIANIDGAIAGLAATHGLRAVIVTPYLVILH